MYSKYTAELSLFTEMSALAFVQAELSEFSISAVLSPQSSVFTRILPLSERASASTYSPLEKILSHTQKPSKLSKIDFGSLQFSRSSLI